MPEQLRGRWFVPAAGEAQLSRRAAAAPGCQKPLPGHEGLGLHRDAP